MIAFKLALRNLIGAGLRTWLNVIVLSFSFVIIIWQQGLLDGWNRQARKDTIDWEIGGGEYWQENYDPYDPFSIDDSHAFLPAALQQAAANGDAAAVLVSRASIYPEGQVQTVILKGIDPDQKILQLPTGALEMDSEEIPALIGVRMARSTGLKEGDYVTVRWRDKRGTFDAADAKIAAVFKTTVGKVDNSQLWIPLSRLQEMLQTPGEATYLVMPPEFKTPAAYQGWIFRDREYLLQDLTDLIKMKSAGGSVLYVLLLFLAMLAIFDTQVLSIFKRRKEIGTLIALGMTRGRVVRLFTIEGAMHGILAGLLAAVYGIPLLMLQAAKGFGLPSDMTDNMGLVVADKIFPAYGAGLILGTTALVMVTVTVVSYLPARKIAKLQPTDALKGKIS